MITLRSDLGGGPKHLLDLMAQIEKNGEFQLFFAGPDDEPFGDPLRKKAKETFLLNHRKFNLSSLLGLRKFCFKNKIRLIHSHGRGAGIYSRLLSVLTGIPTVHTFHGLHFKDDLPGRIKVFLDRLLQSFTTHSIFVSQDELRQASELKILNGKYSVIENGVEIPSAEEKAVPSVYKRNAEEIVLGSLLRNDYFKAPDLLVQHLKHVHAQPAGKSFRLLLAGVSPDDLNIPNAEAPGSLQLLGPVYPSQSLLNSIQIYTSSARHEGLPLAVLEAMANGIPCLLSKVKGHEQIILQGGALGFELENSQDFYEKLILLCESSQLRDQLKETALALARDLYSLRLMAEKTANVYRSILKSEA